MLAEDSAHAKGRTQTGTESNPRGILSPYQPFSCVAYHIKEIPEMQEIFYPFLCWFLLGVFWINLGYTVTGYNFLRVNPREF